MSFNYESQNPLENAEITLALKKAGKNTWICGMKATAKGFLPGAEQFAVKTEEEMDEITNRP